MSDATPAPFEITDRLHPPRRSAWQRVKIVGIVIGVFVIARIVWGIAAAHMLKRALDEVAATGAPVTLAQLQPPIPDDRNGAAAWLAAFEAVDPKQDVPASSELEFNAYPPYPDAYYDLMEKGVAANAKAIMLTREARQYPQVNWNENVTGYDDKSWKLGHSFNASRGLANVMADAAVHAQMHGDDAEAIERVRDVLGIARADRAVPMMLGDLVSIGINAMAMDRLQIINSQMKSLGDPSAMTQPLRGPATRQQIQALIADVLELSRDDSMSRAMKCERVISLHDLDELRRRSILIRPMFDTQSAHLARNAEVLIAAAGKPTFPEAEDLLKSNAEAIFLPKWECIPPGKAGGLREAPRMTRMGAFNMAFSYERYIETSFRVRQEMRLAAMALAVRLYFLEHKHWPASANELIPNYMPALPDNPFSRTHATIGYILIKGGLPDGSDRPMVYGNGSRDEQVDGTLAPPVPTFGWNSNGTLQMRDVTMWSPPPPATKPSEETVDDHPDKPDQPGQSEK